MSSAAAMTNRLREAYHHDEFLAFSSDAAMRGILTELAKQHDWPDYTVHEGGVAAAIQFLVTVSSPRRLVVDLGDAADPVTAVQMLRDTCAAGTVIVALSAVNDVKLYREICRAGATDYVVKPTTCENSTRRWSAPCVRTKKAATPPPRRRSSASLSCSSVRKAASVRARWR